MGIHEYLDLEKKAFANVPKVAKQALQFDKIHLEKVLEMVYYMVLAFLFSILISAGINRSMKRVTKDVKKRGTSYLVGYLVWYTVLIGIAAYYIPKLIKIIPFIFWWDTHYIPGFHGESSYGIGISMGLVFYSILNNYNTILQEVCIRLFPNSFKF